MEDRNEAAMGMALAIRWAYRHLDGLLAVPGIDGDALAVAGCAVTSIVLRPFAVELALKALYMQESGDGPRPTHDLRMLFKLLEPGTQASVEQRFERIRSEKISQGIYSGEAEPLLDVLTIHKDDFETWRYGYEGAAGGLHTRPTVLNSVFEAVAEEYALRSQR